MEWPKIILMILYITIGIVMPGILIYRVIKSVRSFRKSQRKLDEFSIFNKEILNYAEEIKDSHVKSKYIKYMSDIITDYKVHIDEYIHNSKKKTKDMKQDIFDKFGDHIPSLKKEFRDKKLNQILDD